MKLLLQYLSHIRSRFFIQRSQNLDRRQLRSIKALKIHQTIQNFFPSAARTFVKNALIGLVISLSLCILAQPIYAVTTTLSFDQTPVLVSGTPLAQGAIYRFANVTTGVDALVEVTTIQGALLRALDDNATFAPRFQPVIAPATGSLINAQSYVRFNFKLTPSSTPAGTSFAAAPVTNAINVYLSTQDIDGNGGTNTIREFIEVLGSQATYITNPSFLQPMVTLPILGGIGYEQKDSINVQNGIGTLDTYEIYSFMGETVGQFSIVGGNITGSAGCVIGDTVIGGGCARQNSWTFNVSDVQRLDFGDAPVSYGNAYHAVPPTPTVRLGATVDGDDARFNTVGADGDDLNNTDDEQGVASFPLLSTGTTSYTLNVTCAGANTPVSGWIDFNRDGSFQAAEQASSTCNGTTVALNWTGISGTAGQTYARFRTATSATEVANPTGQGSDGEVEDYTLTINLKASVLLVKRITAINGQTTNPNDGTVLTTVINSTATTNDDPAKKWPVGYLQGAVNAGIIKPGDTIEYTVYYLNDDGAITTSLKVCDPIKGRQTYVPNSLKLLPGGANNPTGIIALTDIQDLTIDRANSYIAGAAPIDCNATNSTIIGTDRGGVAIQFIGSGASTQPALPNIPAATAVGNPITSYGWFRFTTKVDP
jgi:GEVED domain